MKLSGSFPYNVEVSKDNLRILAMEYFIFLFYCFKIYLFNFEKEREIELEWREGQRERIFKQTPC